jgi:hypothetical protein
MMGFEPDAPRRLRHDSESVADRLLPIAGAFGVLGKTD